MEKIKEYTKRVKKEDAKAEEKRNIMGVIFIVILLLVVVSTSIMIYLVEH